MVRRRRRTLRPIELVPAGGVDRALLDDLGHALQAHLGVQWSVGDALPLDAAWREPESGLYHSIHLMHALLDRAEGGNAKRTRRWWLAIADAGLCADGVGPVLGEAALDGECAVVAVQPLRAGSGADGEVLLARLLTGAVHEIGHLAGAVHCVRASCVMFPSLNIAETDLKGCTFCAECRRRLHLRGLQES